MPWHLRNEVRGERGVLRDVGDQLPKNSESDMYAIPMWGELAYMHRR